VCLTKFENYQFFLNKISHRFLATTELISGQKSLLIVMLNIIILDAIMFSVVIVSAIMQHHYAECRGANK
jgi:hypothetical protein